MSRKKQSPKTRGGRVSEPHLPISPEIETPLPSQVPARARLFRNGRSQAVRLPMAFRFEGDEVLIRREGDQVILEPVHRRTWPRGYFERLRSMALLFADFEAAAPLPPGGTTVDFDRT